MNDLENIFHVPKIAQLNCIVQLHSSFAQFSCTLCVDNLDHNLFTHTDKCKKKRLNCVRIYILWYVIAVEQAEYLMGTECCEEYFKQEEGRDKDERNNT